MAFSRGLLSSVDSFATKIFLAVVSCFGTFWFKAFSVVGQLPLSFLFARGESFWSGWSVVFVWLASAS